MIVKFNVVDATDAGPRVYCNIGSHYTSMFAPTDGLSHFGNFTLESVKKNKAIYQFTLADKDGDTSTGHFKLNKRGKIAFYGEEGGDDSKLSKDDPLLFRSDASDAFSWGDITKGVSSMSDIVEQVGHYGTIAAKGLDTADSIFDSLSDFGRTTGLFRRSDDLIFDDILNGVERGISISGQLVNAVAPIIPFLL